MRMTAHNKNDHQHHHCSRRTRLCGPAAGSRVRKEVPDRGIRSLGGEDRRLSAVRRSDRRSDHRSVEGGDAACRHQRRHAARTRRFHRRRRSDACRRGASAGFRASPRRQRIGRAQPQARRDRRVRVDRLSGGDRGNLHSGHREALGNEVAAGFLRRVFARAHQSGRSRAFADAHHQGRVGRHGRKRSSGLQRFTEASSPPACIARAASRSPKRPR